jgi:hypothetical protein
MIECLQSGCQRVFLIGLDQKPTKGSIDRYFARLVWLRRAVWQDCLLLEDGRWIMLPEEIRSKPHSQIFKNAEFVLK